MRITFDSDKRNATLAQRGLDFAEAPIVFGQAAANLSDTRFVYPELRFATFGYLRNRMVVVVWTPTAAGSSR